MYSWNEDTSGWYGEAKYSYRSAGSTKRAAAAERARAHGPRTYEGKSGPNETIIDPRKHIRSESPNPLIIAVDVTGSMAHWPFEIFDRLPLLYNTPILGHRLEGETTAENVQARLRAVILMSFVNRYGGLLLNTSNKTELALGYATLCGDMAGTLCPIADLTKPEVYALARWINASRRLIPAYILERPPSAELRPAQVDPFDYPQIAPALERFIQENRSNPALRRSEHKRWQMGVILKVSQKAFGTGRLMPITRR